MNDRYAVPSCLRDLKRYATRLLRSREQMTLGRCAAPLPGGAAAGATARVAARFRPCEWIGSMGVERNDAVLFRAVIIDICVS